MQTRTVAIIGASTERSKFGNKAVRAYVKLGWDVYPINPHAEAVEGVRAYASLRDVPLPIHRVAVYVPPQVGIKLLPDIAAVKPDEFFVNPGAESDELLDEARRLGLDPILACAIMDLGASPSAFPDR